MERPAQSSDFYLAGSSQQRSRTRSISISTFFGRPRASHFATQHTFQDLPRHFDELAVDDEPIDRYGDSRPRVLSHGHVSHQPGGLKSIIRRASTSLRGMVNRRPLAVRGEAAYGGGESADPARPSTAHPAWHRIRHPHGIRQSRSFYGLNVTYEPSVMAERSAYTSYMARPGIGNEPPVIPESSGAAAKAAAAIQNEYFVRQAQFLYPNSSEECNDVESGVGITVTSPEERASLISRVDFVAKLPTELAIHIFGQLDASALANAQLVSVHWRQMIENQHIWRDSCLRETTAAFATSNPVQPNTGQGIPMPLPSTDWKDIYRVRTELANAWRKGNSRPVFLNGHTDSIYCLQFDEYVHLVISLTKLQLTMCRRKIITGSRDRTIRVWDLHTLKCQLIIGPPDVVSNYDMLFDAEGNTVHSATNSHSNERIVESIPKAVSFVEHHNASILCLQFDDKVLITGSSDGSCIVYDIHNEYRPIMRLRRHTAAVLDLAFDDKHIVTCSKDVSICVWDRVTGELIRQLRGHKGPVNAVQMRGNTIVSCSGDCRVKLWNIDTGKNIREFVGHTKGLACSQFSEDGRFVASAGNDKTIRIWDANTGECIREIKAHKNLVRSLHIDSVSGRLISASYDTDIKVWDMKTGEPLLEFPQWHTSWVLSAKSDYRRIVSTGQEPRILILDFGAEIEGIEKLESGGQ